MELTQKQFIVAAMLIDGPAHGYQLEQRIQSEAMRRTVTIGFSSIYQILNTLEKRGYVRHTEAVANGKLQKRFALTDQGKALLAQSFVSAFTRVSAKDEEFLLALTGVAEIPLPALRALVQERIDNIQNVITALQQYRAEIDDNRETMIQLGYERRIAMLSCERDFLEKWLINQKE